MGYMKSPNWVASCVTEIEAILSYLMGVHQDSAWATHDVSAETYGWKTCTRVRWTLIVSLITSWIIVTRGALLACVCRVVKFLPLQDWLLIWISVTPSEMGDSLFAVFKCRIISFIILWWQHCEWEWLLCSHGLWWSYYCISYLCILTLGCKPYYLNQI
jgi:hypothetical protein